VARKAHPDAVFMAHPECRKTILDMADSVLSTSGMIRFAKTSPQLSFIVGTEVGLMYALQKACPNKAFYPASEDMVCPDMKKIHLADVLRSLETLEGQVKVPEAVRIPALEAVRRMIGIAG
jgi:quinolinate synthase